MTKPYPMELRLRALRFVEAGESRHAVAKRLGVSVSCVIKWLQRFSKTGSVAPDKIGGHVKPKIAGPHRDWVLAQVETSDVTLHGLKNGLALRGLKVEIGTIWNFLHRAGKSFKKQFMGLSRIARPLRDGATGGRNISRDWISSDWYSSTKPGPKPTWHRYAVGARKGAACTLLCPMAIGEP